MQVTKYYKFQFCFGQPHPVKALFFVVKRQKTPSETAPHEQYVFKKNDVFWRSFVLSVCFLGMTEASSLLTAVLTVVSVVSLSLLSLLCLRCKRKSRKCSFRGWTVSLSDSSVVEMATVNDRVSGGCPLFSFCKVHKQKKNLSFSRTS